MNEIDPLSLRLRIIIRLLIRRAYGVATDGGPARAEQEVMAWLEEKGAMTPGELATVEKVRPQSIGQTLDSLDRHGWIERKPAPGDRRKKLVILSESGRRALSEARAVRQAWLVDALTKMSDADRRTLTEAMEILERMAKD